MSSRFDIGEQPCQNFRGQMQANAHAMWENRHECYHSSPDGERCEMLVSFCENCHCDHHEGGGETCACRRSRTHD